MNKHTYSIKNNGFICNSNVCYAKPAEPAAGGRGRAGVRATATPRDHFAAQGGREARRSTRAPHTVL